MIQDIAPHVLDIHMRLEMPEPHDALLVFRESGDSRSLEVVAREQDGGSKFPPYSLFEGTCETVFAFNMDEDHFHLALPGHSIAKAPEGWEFRRVGYLDRIAPGEAALAVATGSHLFRWYSSNRFCGRCGSALAPSGRERSLVCSSCGKTLYPRISPVVIVALVHEGRLLTIRYAGARGTHRALVAGFVEIGETAEQAVEREVFEEVGLCATNIRYVCSQPWGYMQELILGYTAKLDGDSTIAIDERELADARWTLPEEIADMPGNPSLTYELMQRFKHGRLG